MKRLVFSKTYFTRHPEMDFTDDGTNFRIVYYKDKLPLSAASADGRKYVAIRLDYLGFRWDNYKEDYKVLDEFNGVDEVDMDKLIANCEYILNKYLNREKEEEKVEKKSTQMKRVEHDWYSAISFKGGPAFRFGTTVNSLDEMKEAIDASNRYAVRRGYEAEQWIIVYGESYTWYSADGVFVKSESREDALEVYPAEL